MPSTSFRWLRMSRTESRHEQSAKILSSNPRSYWLGPVEGVTLRFVDGRDGPGPAFMRSAMADLPTCALFAPRACRHRPAEFRNARIACISGRVLSRSGRPRTGRPLRRPPSRQRVDPVNERSVAEAVVSSATPGLSKAIVRGGVTYRVLPPGWLMDAA
jgi:hypothetical protein